MSMAYRRRIVKAILDGLDNRSDIKAVFWWYSDQIEPDNLPAVNVLDRSDVITHEYNTDHHTLHIDVDIYAATASDVVDLVDVVKDTILQSLDSLVTNVSVESVTIDKHSESTEVYVATLQVAAYYITNNEMEVYDVE